ncbi:MAG TPA: type II toxin-antitoxin system VapC family toxin [Thermoplasmata archaeon]|nr:type II toxin-antitoxin system VapC family toxin [Thermoplasmata archaeon]
MKALDTPILLALLRGSPPARQLVRSLSGEELATTEINMFELELLARADRAPGLERRLAALDRLRRKLTVIPIDERAVRHAFGRERAGATRPTWSPNQLILGALVGSGCEEFYTTPKGPGRTGAHRLKLSIVQRT